MTVCEREQHGITCYEQGCKHPDARAANARRVARNRERRKSADRISHGSRSGYDAGCRCSPCRDARRCAYVEREGGYREHWWREMVTEVHRAARAAWEALRESSMVTNGPAGTHGGVAHYQLSEDEFRAIHPAPTFRDTLRGLRR